MEIDFTGSCFIETKKEVFFPISSYVSPVRFSFHEPTHYRRDVLNRYYFACIHHCLNSVSHRQKAPDKYARRKICLAIKLYRKSEKLMPQTVYEEEKYPSQPMNSF